jgi:hypothetical protein
MPAWLKMAVALIPLFLAALVGVGWTNSHSMGVQAALISRLTEDVEQLERRLETCP